MFWWDTEALLPSTQHEDLGSCLPFFCPAFPSVPQTDTLSPVLQHPWEIGAAPGLVTVALPSCLQRDGDPAGSVTWDGASTQGDEPPQSSSLCCKVVLCRWGSWVAADTRGSGSHPSSLQWA